MSWKTHLDHLIVDGEQANYLASKKLLEQLFEQSTDERWQIILNRDSRLEKLVLSDYQRLLKMTVANLILEFTDISLNKLEK